MKKIVLAIVTLLVMAACNSSKPAESAVDKNEATEEVAFVEAKNYFFKNDQQIPDNVKITSEEEFHKLFGMATVMGENGKPTAIDFNKQMVLAIVMPQTDQATEITPVKVEWKCDTLYYTYDVKTGEKQSYTIQPMSIIIVDKKYENNEVVLSTTK